ncbi:serine/threonine protein kinase [Streptomyces sp. SCA3-4]|uniref:serine/threonine-protein kinase n=1 Tax=Streptomyces sichuanensis TaxID=2871810 RepID=UPI001CE2EF22|nr:serine/threonine-protein kinase [Streptomyces sichuanensis]MCA6096042.1 serine/threonine protein kinase [Streptomyces sichuanensis]
MDGMDTAPHRPLLAGRYRLLEQLGQGGMGVVWLALDEVLDREVAAKEVRAPEHMNDEDVRVLYARLKQEARAAARVTHPNVITVHDVVEQQGRPWIVMELVRGQSLDKVLRQEGVLQVKEAARIGGMVLQALRAAHAVGVLHRDVKPANVLIQDGGRVVLTDFGIAVIEGAGTLTRTGDLVGSAEYLAPERAMGRRPGIPSDLWSLGTLLYVAVEGVSPFRRGDALSTLRAVVDDDPAPVRRAGLLTPLLEGLLRKDPEARMGSAEAEQLLEAIASGRLTEEPTGYVRTTVDEQLRNPGATPAPVTVPDTPTPESSPPTPVSSPSPFFSSTPPPPSPSPSLSTSLFAPFQPGSGPDGEPLPAGVPVGLQQGGLATPIVGPGTGTPSPVGHPLRPVPGPGPDRGPGPRRAAWVVAAVVALLLLVGGVAVLVALRNTEGSGSPGGDPTETAGPQRTGDATAPATGGPTAGPTGNATAPAPPPPDSEEKSPTPTSTCNGGWVYSC